MALRSVVFPQPDGPMSAITSHKDIEGDAIKKNKIIDFHYEGTPGKVLSVAHDIDIVVTSQTMTANLERNLKVRASTETM